MGPIRCFFIRTVRARYLITFCEHPDRFWRLPVDGFKYYLKNYIFPFKGGARLPRTRIFQNVYPRLHNEYLRAFWCPFSGPTCRRRPSICPPERSPNKRLTAQRNKNGICNLDDKNTRSTHYTDRRMSEARVRIPMEGRPALRCCDHVRKKTERRRWSTGVLITGALPVVAQIFHRRGNAASGSFPSPPPFYRARY